MNKYEIAMDYKKELKKRISADYERRVKQWMAADPSQLIDAAEEITAARLIRRRTPDFCWGWTSRWMSWQTAGLRRMVWMPPMVRSCFTASGRFGRI